MQSTIYVRLDGGASVDDLRPPLQVSAHTQGIRDALGFRVYGKGWVCSPPHMCAWMAAPTSAACAPHCRVFVCWMLRAWEACVHCACPLCATLPRRLAGTLVEYVEA